MPMALSGVSQLLIPVKAAIICCTKVSLILCLMSMLGERNFFKA